MAKRIFATGLVAGACACMSIVACSSSLSTSPPANGDAGSSGNDPTPPGATPVTSAPYAACTPLGLGSFTVSGAYATPKTTSCASPGEPTAGAADTHCQGVTPQAVSGAACSILAEDAGPPANEDAGASVTPGPCGENGPDYGATMYGTAADDDDCKYHMTYTATPICENDGTYFVVTASYLTQNGAPLTGASTFAEACLSDTHPAPAIDSRPPQGQQKVVEGPPGTYTIGPVQFDAPGDWTVRFHFNEFCCDIADDSPHGHAAFHVTVP